MQKVTNDGRGYYALLSSGERIVCNGQPSGHSTAQTYNDKLTLRRVGARFSWSLSRISGWTVGDTPVDLHHLLQLKFPITEGIRLTMLSAYSLWQELQEIQNPIANSCEDAYRTTPDEVAYIDHNLLKRHATTIRAHFEALTAAYAMHERYAPYTLALTVSLVVVTVAGHLCAFLILLRFIRRRKRG